MPFFQRLRLALEVALTGNWVLGMLIVMGIDALDLAYTFSEGIAGRYVSLFVPSSSAVLTFFFVSLTTELEETRRQLWPTLQNREMGVFRNNLGRSARLVAGLAVLNTAQILFVGKK